LAGDVILILPQFAKPIDMAALLILGTYYPGQWLIALSAGREHPRPTFGRILPDDVRASAELAYC
jgi:hypothetical protein